MDPRSLDNTSASISDIVTADKLDAVSAGIVKDDESQSLSTLSEKQSALGTRATSKASPSKKHIRTSADTGTANADSDAHQVLGMHPQDPRRPTLQANDSRFARCWSARQYPNSTTPTSSRGWVTPTTPGEAQSGRSQPCGIGRRKGPTPPQAVPRGRARAQKPPRARAPKARRRRKRQASTGLARRKRATPPKRRGPPRRRPSHRPATQPSLARSAEAGLPQAVGCSAGSSPSYSSRSS